MDGCTVSIVRVLVIGYLLLVTLSQYFGKWKPASPHGPPAGEYGGGGGIGGMFGNKFYFPSKNDLKKYKEATKEMFLHGYKNYMKNAFPADELKPISCTPRYREGRGTLDDSLGEYSLTLIDSLSSLVVLGLLEDFEVAVRLVIDHVTFDSNVTVSVFETTIRVLGGLLSAHLLIKEHYLLSWYNDELLHLSQDLANRLLPAFTTKTGIPYSRVNLKYGVEVNEISQTCTACAGTLLLEFGLLSRLLNNSIYEKAAHKAITAIWSRRSKLGLLGNTIDAQTGHWKVADSSIGAGIDSFYEYLYKSYLFFNESDYYTMFNETYKQVMMYLNHDHWYLPVDMHSGNSKYTWVDSLSAFWPGLQVMIGDVDQGRRSHAKFNLLWNRYGAIPERYDILRGISVQGLNNYPLRPEFVESTYLLYRSTKDPYYLEVGKNIFKALQNCRVKCGYASISNVETNQLEDRMDSFFLSETCKYLFLLFDIDNFINHNNFIFTTEGHPLPLSMHWHNLNSTHHYHNHPSKIKSSTTYHATTKVTAFTMWKDLTDNPFNLDPLVAKWKQIRRHCNKGEA